MFSESDDAFRASQAPKAVDSGVIELELRRCFKDEAEGYKTTIVALSSLLVMLRRHVIFSSAAILQEMGGPDFFDKVFCDISSCWYIDLLMSKFEMNEAFSNDRCDFFDMHIYGLYVGLQLYGHLGIGNYSLQGHFYCS